MTKYVEYRTLLPFTKAQYEISSRYTTAKMQLIETGNENGFEVIHNYEPRTHSVLGDGIASSLVMHAREQLPGFMRTLMPTGAAEVMINRFLQSSGSKTTFANHYMKQNFSIVVDALCEQGNVASDNPLNLTDQKLINRRIIKIDLLDPYLSAEDLSLTPALSNLQLTARDNKPLTINWQSTETDQVILYHFFEIEFKWWGLQERVESQLEKSMYRLLAIYFRRMYAWMDEWHGMTVSDIEHYESQVKQELQSKIKSPEFNGIKFL